MRLRGAVEQEYDQAKFYQAATDKRGHSKSVRFSLPPDQMYRLAVLVANDKTPYQTTQDFIRDAIVHRLHWIENNLPDMEPVANVFTRAAELSYQLAVIEASEKLVNYYREAAVHAGDKEREQLAGQIRDTIAEADTLQVRQVDVDKLKDLLARLQYGAIG